MTTKANLYFRRCFATTHAWLV